MNRPRRHGEGKVGGKWKRTRPGELQIADMLPSLVDDPGEPHDLADPFRSSSSSQGAPQAPVKTHMDPLLQRQRARDSFEAAQQHAQRARQKQREREESVKRDKGMDEMRALLDKLREDNKNG